jgi:tungstate transport system ATP-binding protein
MSEANVYRILGLTKDYNQRRILDIPAFDIQPGEMLAIVGPSGSGKSTLLRLLNFLEPPTQGQIEFAGTIFSASQEMPLALRRQVTTVFQRPLLLDDSVWDNIAYGLRLRGWKDSAAEIRRALASVGLENLSHQPARTLSGGEAQRVALARALILRPKVLLLDEPTANLDPYNVGLIEQTALKLNQEQGTTLVLVTHNVFQAKRMAHRVAFLLEGKMIEVSDNESFFNQPLDPRTAAFVRGEMVY